MKKISYLIAILFTALSLNGCGIYNFTGGDVGDAKTFEVRLFQNYAAQSPGSTFEPGLDRDFTRELQDLILNQTSLDLVSSGGDLVYEGEITEYRITPMTATANQTSAQNRLTMTVTVRFFNNKKEDVDFDQRFSFFYDYGATTSYSAIKSTALEEIFERITQDIFNASLADW
ncbi:LptE family protein [Cellulophaga baltica]|uniref:LptE family protein n=1 Tax=Cellulophaga baltica TaxID=76594 RepID=UPI0037C6924C